MNEALPVEDAMNETPMTEAPKTEQSEAAAPPAVAAEAEVVERRALAKHVAEALIFASPEPLAQKAIADRMPAGTDVEALLAEIASDYAERGIRLVKIAESWTFRTAPELAPHLQLEREVKRIDKDLAAIEKKMSSKGFLERAPKEVIDETNALKTQLTEARARLEESRLLASELE